MHASSHIEDKRLLPILEKVQADVRLSAEDGVALYRKLRHFGASATWPTWCASASTAT